jgi:hypothetical protein
MCRAVCTGAHIFPSKYLYFESHRIVSNCGWIDRNSTYALVLDSRNLALFSIPCSQSAGQQDVESIFVLGACHSDFYLGHSHLRANGVCMDSQSPVAGAIQEWVLKKPVSTKTASNSGIENVYSQRTVWFASLVKLRH